MHHTQLPDTTLSDKVCSARPLAGISSVAPVFVADLSLLDSCNCSTITNDSHGDLRFQSFDFTSHFLSNQQYSITAVTTSTGSVAERYVYTAYGQPTFLDASGTPLTTQTSTLNARYLYTGREWDATLGLYHFRARWMSGKTGRFLTRDPIGFDGSEWGLYEFLEDSPYDALDPIGQTVLKFSEFINPMAQNPKQPKVEKSEGDDNCTTLPGNPKKCEGGYCLWTKNLKMDSCKITELVGDKNNGILCGIVTKARICSTLKSRIEDSAKKNPGQVMQHDYCKSGCSCDDRNAKLEEVPIWIVFHHDLLENSGCKFTISGTIKVSGGGVAILPCK